MARTANKVELTPAEKECLRAYRLAHKELGMNPTGAEVGQRMTKGSHRTNASLLMKRLAKKGKLLRRRDIVARCYAPAPRQQAAA